MASHTAIMSAACRPSARAPVQSARSNAGRVMKAAGDRLRPLRPLRAAQVAQAGSESSEPEVTTSSDEQPRELMSMCDSLVERAKEVAATGVVNDDFKAAYVPELEAELAVLQERAQQAEAQASALEETLKSTKDQFLRLTADFENFRKRTANERDTLKASIKGDTIMQLVPLIDNFELAKTQIKTETEGEQRVDAAYQGLYKQMVEIFRGLGVEAVPGVGAPFDPNVHDGIMREPNEDVPDGTVLEEFRKGFKLGDTLLRPAMVKVSYSEKPAQQGSEQESSAGESSAE